uniref:Snake toxin/toxin-like domain-containing protein n=1 Tax=Naja naja TaxID=35670 RepID=A0A8C6XG49_NAJNA
CSVFLSVSLPKSFWRVALFSWFAADSIICFMCEEQISNWKCLDTTICSEGEKRCIILGVGCWGFAGVWESP